MAKTLTIQTIEDIHHTVFCILDDVRNVSALSEEREYYIRLTITELLSNSLQYTDGVITLLYRIRGETPFSLKNAPVHAAPADAEYISCAF